MGVRETGYLTYVETATRGSETSVAGTAGDPTITVADVSDFIRSDGVGKLDIGSVGVPLGYTDAVLNADGLTGTVTLAAALAADVDEGVRVDVWARKGPSTYYTATVASVAGELTAVLPGHYIPHLAGGPRDEGDREFVEVERFGSRWVVVDVQFQDPSVNASYLTPGSLSLSTSHDPTEDMSTVTFLGATLAQPNGTVVLNATANTGQIFDMITAAAAGYDPRQSCRFATTGSETYTIVSGSVTQIAGTTLDSGSPGISDRILVKNAPAASGAGVGEDAHPANGIYRVTNATTNLTLTRTTDMSGFHDPQGDFVFVQAGGQAACGFVVIVPSSTGSFTYGTDNIRWTQCSGSSSGSGSVDGGTP